MNRILHRISPRLIALLSALIMLLSVLPAYAAGLDIDGDIDGDDVVISKVGDINADGSVDVKDLVRLMKYISGADVTICGSDVNGDGVTDTRDLVRLMRIITSELYFPTAPCRNFPRINIASTEGRIPECSRTSHRCTYRII